jgi:hypothetical protein
VTPIGRFAPLAAFLAAFSAQADSGNRLLIFDIDFSQYRSDFEYTGGTMADTSVARVTLDWYEPIGTNTELGIFAGASELTQRDRPLTAGVEAQGYHGGVGARGRLFDTTSLHLTWDLRYRYDRVESDDDPDQSLTIAWYTSQAQLGAALPLGRATLVAGTTYATVDGEERARGVVNATTDFETGAHTGGYAGIELHVGGDGFVGATAYGGEARGVTLYFARRYSTPPY